MAKVRIEKDGTVTWGDNDTEHLNSTAAMREHLAKSLADVRDGNLIKMEWIELEDGDIQLAPIHETIHS